MNDTIDIISLPDFQKNATAILRKMKGLKAPIGLKEEGKVNAFLLNAKTYQKLTEEASFGAMVRGVALGLDSMEKNKGIPLKKAFSALKNDIQQMIQEK